MESFVDPRIKGGYPNEGSGQSSAKFGGEAPRVFFSKEEAWTILNMDLSTPLPLRHAFPSIHSFEVFWYARAFWEGNNWYASRRTSMLFIVFSFEKYRSVTKKPNPKTVLFANMRYFVSNQLEGRKDTCTEAQAQHQISNFESVWNNLFLRKNFHELSLLT